MHCALSTHPLLSDTWVTSSLGITPEQERPSPSPSVTHMSLTLHLSCTRLARAHSHFQRPTLCCFTPLPLAAFSRTDGRHQRGQYLSPWVPSHLDRDSAQSPSPARLSTGFTLSQRQSGDDASSPTPCEILEGPPGCAPRKAVCRGRK